MGPYKLTDLKKIYSDWDAVYDEKAGNNLSWKPRPTQDDLVGAMTALSSERSLQNANYILLSMKGNPFYYYGDELGMVNKFNKIEDYRDIETLAEYEKLKLEGGNLEQFIENQKTGERDNGQNTVSMEC
jgi:oligo-1,6-glucosidase